MRYMGKFSTKLRILFGITKYYYIDESLFYAIYAILCRIGNGNLSFMTLIVF